MTELSPPTQVAILLTAKWSVNRAAPLTQSEFAEVMRALGSSPQGVKKMLERQFDLSKVALDPDRVEALLSRALGVFQKLDRWVQAGLWVASWSDPGYPERLKHLKQRAPALVFGYGNPNAFGQQCLAVVGSRNAAPERLIMATELGKSFAMEGIMLVSGGARGVDAAAMIACANAGGTVTGILADSLLRESSRKDYREAILDGRMCLMSEVHPEASFETTHAMSRNRLIHAYADASIVVESELNKGGTWAGSVDALQQGRAVFVIEGAKAARDLVSQGALPVSLNEALRPGELLTTRRVDRKTRPETTREQTLF